MKAGTKRIGLRLTGDAGAGKTTLHRRLVDYLRKSGYVVAPDPREPLDITWGKPDRVERIVSLRTAFERRAR